MRIASNILSPALVVAALGLFAAFAPAVAADTEGIAVAAASDPAPVAAPMPPADAAKPASGDISKSVVAMEDKVSDNAKNLIKRLDATGDGMTLEDLNTARQMVARIEALIDVEKHLVELEKVRNERGGHSTMPASTLAAAIPASALAPLPPPALLPHVSEKPKPSFSGSEVVRISGADGRYVALVRYDGDQKTVRTGDELAGGASVRWISASAVGIESHGTLHILRIKNVDAIYSAMR